MELSVQFVLKSGYDKLPGMTVVNWDENAEHAPFNKAQRQYYFGNPSDGGSWFAGYSKLWIGCMARLFFVAWVV